MTSTHERLCAILMKDYEIEPAMLVPEATLEVLGVDSLGVAELMFNIEDEFKITLTENPVGLATLQDLTRYIDDLVAAQSGVDEPMNTDPIRTVPNP